MEILSAIIRVFLYMFAAFLLIDSVGVLLYEAGKDLVSMIRERHESD